MSRLLSHPALWRKKRISKLGVYLFVALLLGIMPLSMPMAADNSADSVLDKPPTGFFTKLALAHGYQAVKDVFQTDRYRPEKPSTTFKSDVDAIYLVFDLLPRENPAHIIGQLYLDKGNRQQAEKLLYEEGVYLQTSQDSGFLEFPRPPQGWEPGNYRVKIHLGEKVTEASQLGTLRFKIEPAS